MKGWSCKAEDKIAGGDSRIKVSNDRVTMANLPGMSRFTISRGLANTVDEIIPGVDSQYIHFLHHTPFRHHRQTIEGRVITYPLLYADRQTFDLSTPLARAATLVLVSSAEDTVILPSRRFLPARNSEHTTRYYDAFCHYAKLAIEGRNVLDLAHATYCLALSQGLAGLRFMDWPTSKQHIESVLVHILQFCRISEACSNADLSRPLSNSEFKGVLLQLRDVLYGAFSLVCKMLLEDYPSKLSEFSITITDIIRLSAAVLSRGVDCSGLILHVRVSFMRLLERAEYGRGVDQTPTSMIVSQIVTYLGKIVEGAKVFPGVVDLLDQVFEIERHLHSNTYGPLEESEFLRFPHLRLPFTPGERLDRIGVIAKAQDYCFGQLMRNLLPPGEKETEPRWSNLLLAIAICRLIHLDDLCTSPGTRNRNLFWAGLVMMKWNYDPGKLRGNVG
jgi:hypothetical protein